MLTLLFEEVPLKFCWVITGDEFVRCRCMPDEINSDTERKNDDDSNNAREFFLVSGIVKQKWG